MWYVLDSPWTVIWSIIRLIVLSKKKRIDAMHRAHWLTEWSRYEAVTIRKRKWKRRNGVLVVGVDDVTKAAAADLADDPLPAEPPLRRRSLHVEAELLLHQRKLDTEWSLDPILHLLHFELFLRRRRRRRLSLHLPRRPQFTRHGL